MFPICERCGCETMDRNCGGWRDDFVHNCLTQLRHQETSHLEALSKTVEKIESIRASGVEEWVNVLTPVRPW